MTFCCNCLRQITADEKRAEAYEFVPANGGFRHKVCPGPRELGARRPDP